MKPFLDVAKLMTFARGLVQPRLDALKKDVTHCLQEPHAPFPAIVLCFSTIDFLGALAAGDAKKHRKTTEQSKSFMRTFMKYLDQNAALLMDVFRHKIVHLAAPKPVVEFRGKNVAWRYRHADAAIHLVLEPVSPPVTVAGFPGAPLTADYEFGISIQHFAEDIEGAVTRAGDGYFAQLETLADLQVKFVAAVYDFYDPLQ
jgi:hypothetical protein